MKIAEDKVATFPPHAFTRQDVKIILAAVPDDWKQDFDTVRLSSAMPYNSNCFQFACLDQSVRRFTLATRGLEKGEALTKALSALALRSALRKSQSLHPTAKDEEQATKVVAPLVKELLPQLSKTKIWLDHPTSRHK